MRQEKLVSAALIIGYTIQGLAISRALNRMGVNVYALVHRDVNRFKLFQHPVFYTDTAKFIFAQSLYGERLVDALLKARTAIPESNVVLFPATDNTVMTLAENWPSLERAYSLSWANCRDRVRSIVQKSNLPGYCDLAGINYPKTAVIESEADIQPCLAKLAFPILLKPDRQVFSFKTHRCDTAKEFADFVHSKVDTWPLIAQEWIEGTERDLYFYTCFSDGGMEYFGFEGRKVRASPPSVGIATIIETIHEPQVRDAAQRLLPILGLSGPVAMEFKKDNNGNYWFIEANVGRTEFCVDLAIESGFNLPYVEFCYATGLPLPQVEDLIQSIWFDTDKEPFCYLHLCIKERSLLPHGKKRIFPYHRRERSRVRFAAALELPRKLYQRALSQLR